MKLRTIVFAAALFVAAAAQAQPPAVSAEHQAARDAMHKACADDSKSLCGDKQGREMVTCLRSNAAKLSAGCKQAMSKLTRPAGAPAAK